MLYKSYQAKTLLKYFALKEYEPKSEHKDQLPYFARVYT